MDEQASTVPPPESALEARQARARRRRRRRQIGTALFVAVAVAVFALAFVAVTGGDDSDDENATRGSTAGPSTTVAPPRGPYEVTTGVNVRESPATSAAVVGTIETGHVVFVACVAAGEVVEGPAGPIAEWLRIVGFGPNGYLTALYVDVGDDLRTDAIPACDST